MILDARRVGWGGKDKISYPCHCKECEGNKENVVNKK